MGWAAGGDVAPLIPERPVLHPACEFARVDGRLAVRCGNQLWTVDDPAMVALASRLIRALDGRPAIAAARRWGMSRLAESLALHSDLSRASLLIERGNHQWWQLPSPPNQVRSGGAATVVGRGKLARSLAAQLHTIGSAVAQRGSDADARAVLRLVIQDRADFQALRVAERRYRSMHVSWCPVFPLFGQIVIGPLVAPHHHGCWHCFERRWLGLADAVRIERTFFVAAARGRMRGRIPDAAADLIAPFVLQAITTWRRQHRWGQVTILDLVSGVRSQHLLTPHPRCRCGRGASLPKSAPSDPPRPRGAHVATPDSPLGRLLDDRLGIVGRVRLEPGKSPTDIVTATARFALPDPELVTGVNWNTSAGIANDASRAVLLAAMEGVERYCALSGRAACVAAYTHVADRAIDPRQLPLFDHRQYALPDFPHRPFDPKRPIAWVVGNVLRKNATVLVPHDAAYCSPERDRLLSETTSGVAAHVERDAATLNALLELVERDAFMVFWLNRSAAPRIDLDAVRTVPHSAHLLDEIAASGAEPILLNTTTDIGVPSVVALALRADGLMPALVAGAGCDLNAHQACAKALREVAGALRMWTSRERRPGTALPVHGVHRLRDHAAAYAHPTWRRHAEFLWQSVAGPLPGDAGAGSHSERLSRLVDRLTARQIEPIVVDLTTPDLAQRVVVVRAVALGLQPIGFGVHGVRLNRSRLKSAALRMALAAPARFNPIPHCFP
jgi:ribosomal protein S12 methylthiotransferase accessory factor